MPIFRTKLMRKLEVAWQTTAFYLIKPEGFTYLPGQYINVRLIGVPGLSEEAKSFSLASSPEEQDLIIVARMCNSEFKNNLAQVAEGAEIEIAGPLGSFTLHQNTSRPAVFLAGGIGIAPVRSILYNATLHHLTNRLYLFYSNRRPEDAVWLPELRNLQMDNLNFVFVGTMTKIIDSEQIWKGETGRIDLEMVKRYLKEPNPVYYISGVPQTVGALKELLIQGGVSPADIKTEEFVGY